MLGTSAEALAAGARPARGRRRDRRNRRAGGRAARSRRPRRRACAGRHRDPDRPCRARGLRRARASRRRWSPRSTRTGRATGDGARDRLRRRRARRRRDAGRRAAGRARLPHRVPARPRRLCPGASMPTSGPRRPACLRGRRLRRHLAVEDRSTRRSPKPEGRRAVAAIMPRPGARRRPRRAGSRHVPTLRPMTSAPIAWPGSAPASSRPRPSSMSASARR